MHENFQIWYMHHYCDSACVAIEARLVYMSFIDSYPVRDTPCTHTHTHTQSHYGEDYTQPKGILSFEAIFAIMFNGCTGIMGELFDMAQLYCIM